jgi:hypothetical protein
VLAGIGVGEICAVEEGFEVGRPHELAVLGQDRVARGKPIIEIEQHRKQDEDSKNQ